MSTMQRIIDPFPALIALAALLGVLLSGCSSSGGGGGKAKTAIIDPVWHTEIEATNVTVDAE